MSHSPLARPRARQRRGLSPNQALLAAAVVAALAVSPRAQSQFEELPRRGIPANGLFVNQIALVDVDGDGDLDVVAAENGQSRLFRNDAGYFTDVTATNFPAGAVGSLGVAAGDVDGDGDLDLVFGTWSYPQNHTERLYVNDGTGVFTDVTAAQMPTNSINGVEALAFGDVDGDGDLDLVAAGAGQNRLLVNDGAGTFTDATAAQLPSASDTTNSVALGDVDGDGDLDLVCGNGFFYNYWVLYYGEQNRLYLNDGAGTFTDATATNLPVDNEWTEAVLLEDVDLDGDLDLVFGNVASQQQLGQNRLYLNDGAGGFTDATLAWMPVDNDQTYALALADVDGDGLRDLVCGNRSFQLDRLYLNAGATGFVDATFPRLPFAGGDTSSLAVGDVDGDSDVDILAADWGYFYNTSNVRLLTNLRSQLHAPVEYLIGQTFTLEAYRRFAPASSSADLALPLVSLAPASIPLPPFGTVGIDPTQAVALPAIAIPQPAGVGSLTLAVPVVPSLIGTQLYWQAILVSPSVEVRLSNVVEEVYGPLTTPTITAITPDVAAPGTTVTIDGSDFLMGVTLEVDGNPTPITAFTSDQITFQMPAWASCDAVVEVKNLGNATASDVMNVTPAIAGLSSTVGPAVGGELLTITGTDLLGATAEINGVPLANVQTHTESEITGYTPAGTPGQAVVTVTNAVGCVATTSYLYDATPVIGAVTPPSAVAGTAVTIEGNNFLNGVTLLVDGNPTAVTSFTASTVSFQMPAGVGCDATVEVTNLGSASASSAINATPVIVASQPAGPAQGGTVYFVTGQNLLGATVTIGGNPLASVTSQTQFVIVGITPPGPPGATAVVITNAAGCSATTTFTYN